MFGGENMTLEPIPLVIRREAGYTLDSSPVHHRATQRQTRQTTRHMLTLTPKDNFRDTMHVFGRWEEAGVPGENPCIHGENMQTPHRKASQELNLELSQCEATVLTTTPPCSPDSAHHFQKKMKGY